MVTSSSSERPGEPSARAAESPQRARVLVIDDEPAMGSVVRRVLGKAYEVHAELTVEAAVERIARGESFDVVLCDLMMPGRGGMDFFAIVRELQPLLAERVVFLTGGAFDDRSEAFLEEVAHRTLIKPFTAAALRAAVATLAIK